MKILWFSINKYLLMYIICSLDYYDTLNLFKGVKDKLVHSILCYYQVTMVQVKQIEKLTNSFKSVKVNIFDQISFTSFSEVIFIFSH